MALSLPSGSADIGPGQESGLGSVPKFPHTRAQLSAFARQYKPHETYDTEGDVGEDFNRVTSAFVTRVVSLLVEEQEDELKGLLKEAYGMDDEAVENNVLDLMHKHRDDIAGVPFLFLTPTRRPLSRPSSRASTHSARLHPARPDTPQSAPGSPLAMIFKRPHTPLTSPLAAGGQASSYMSAKSEYSTSPSSSPVLSFAPTTQWTASLPASPLSSPRLLNAKASEFKPIQRPLSAASSNPGPRTETPSPDLWSHGLRATSNLAIAAPLLPDQPLLSHSSLRSSLRLDEDEDDDDSLAFDPFSQKDDTLTFTSLNVTDLDGPWSTSSKSTSSASPEDNFQSQFYGPPHDPSMFNADEELDEETSTMLTDGMTPFDVLSSVFGSTLAPSELEEALATNGFDFERAMSWLVDRVLPPVQNPQIRTQNMGGRLALVSNQMRGNGRGGYQNQPSSPGRAAPRYVNGRPVPGGNRVCRYFVAGECLRADCRFSHDLERALCRFWLRGTCAKGDLCEFLHHLPKDVDINSLNIALGRMNINPNSGPLQPSQPVDEFPVLGYDNGLGGKVRRPFQDSRFSAAVKKPLPQRPNYPVSDAVRREMMGSSADNIHHRSAIIAPRPSPRLKLRLASLVPTLPTGEAINAMYMSYRSRALQLGSARNACLSRAADAWRRGDGAAAKRFSREGQELNAKMASEMAAAAGKLVRERSKITEQAVRARDSSWSDDPNDRTARGKPSGAGLGVCLGVARKDVGDPSLTSDERTETLLDLHGLHANEATEVLEQFLLALEQESFYGLAYVIVGEEKHVATQDASRGASRIRLATGVREWLHRWSYPWMERDGIICIDPLTHGTEELI